MSIKRFNKMNKSDLVKELESHYHTNSADCITVTHSRDCVEVFYDLVKYSKKECVTVLYLDGASSVIHEEVISRKGFKFDSKGYKKLFRKAIELNSAFFITGQKVYSDSYEHNEEDTKQVQELKERSQLVGIELLDHVVMFKNGHYSYHGNGKVL